MRLSNSLPEIQTSRFRLGAAVHARQALTRWAGRFWFAVALPVAVLVILGFFYDSRMLFIAATIIFILFPTLLFIGWHRVLTRPSAVAAMFPQRVTLHGDNEIEVEYFPLKDSEPSRQPELMIHPDDIKSCRILGNNIIITYADSQDLIIPLSSFQKPADSTAFLNRIVPQTAENRL